MVDWVYHLGIHTEIWNMGISGWWNLKGGLKNPCPFDKLHVLLLANEAAGACSRKNKCVGSEIWPSGSKTQSKFPMHT